MYRLDSLPLVFINGVIILLCSTARGQTPAVPFTPTFPVLTAIAGVDFSGASSTDYSAVFHGTASWDFPLTSNDNLTEARFWVGAKVRIAGIAQPGTLSGNIGSLDSFTSYLAKADASTPDKIVQSFETSVHGAYTFLRFKPLNLNSFDVGKWDSSSGEKQPAVVTLSALLGFGEVTPLSPSQANPPVYLASRQIISDYPSSFGVAAGAAASTAACWYKVTDVPTCYVAFVPQEVGFRFPSSMECMRLAAPILRWEKELRGINSYFPRWIAPSS